MALKIIGAGMAGLLAARMLRHHNPVVIEAQTSLPNNHNSVLRFRSETVADALGIPFRKVTTLKTVIPWQNPVSDALAYAHKNAGIYRSDRSITRTAEVNERYIAPPDLIRQMAEGLDIRFGEVHDFSSDEKVISTIPMPNLLKLLGYPAPHPKFEYVNGASIKATIQNCDAYATIMVPNPDIIFSRASITGNELVVELPDTKVDDYDLMDVHNLAFQAADLMGIDSSKVWSPAIYEQPYAKILPIDEHERKSAIFWASTIKGKAFSLGRFATWRPGLLMDDLVKDIKLIDGWLRTGTPGSVPHLDLQYMKG